MPVRLFAMTLAGLLAAAALAEAQVPMPRVPDVRQRSGLVSRFTTPPAYLPPDADRDTFEGTRYADEQDDAHVFAPRNSWRNGGMYGKPLPACCTKTTYPFFRGTPGGHVGEECQSGHAALQRWVLNPFQPFKPVGMYYDRGAHVPIYDFDWTVPGPGPFPWPHFFRRPTGG
jgi:hypothetical protein